MSGVGGGGGGDKGGRKKKQGGEKKGMKWGFDRKTSNKKSENGLRLQ